MITFNWTYDALKEHNPVALKDIITWLDMENATEEEQKEKIDSIDAFDLFTSYLHWHSIIGYSEPIWALAAVLITHKLAYDEELGLTTKINPRRR